MRERPRGSPTADALLRSPSPERRAAADPARTEERPSGPAASPLLALSLPPADPSRQARRLPVRIVKMLTAHGGHLLHPEYLQPLTSAPVSIELDAKKSPLALLAQTCSQIGKPDPPSSSKLSSLSSGGHDKESSGRSKSGEQHHSPDDKSSFKPYSKSSGDSRKDVIVTKSSSDKSFRLPNGSSNSSSASCPPFPPHARSPGSHSPPLHSQSHRQSQSPSARSPTHPQSQHSDRTPPSSEQPSSDSSNGGKKDSDASKSGLDGAQLANSSHVRASANSSNASSACSPRPESKSDSQASSQLGSGHIAPVSPFKPGHSVYSLPPASMGYHGSVIGAYAGYPSQFVPGLDHTKSSLGLGLQGKHPSSSPLTGASPPSLMQGLCRDPYCLTYPNGHHLGGSNCNSCVHDPSSMKSSFPLVYPSHHLHSLHSSALSSSSTPGSLSHPIYTYGFMLPNDPQPHICNWVSVGGPCDKRFATSEELLAHLRTHTALPGMVDGKMLYPSSVSSSASCHLHLPPPSSPGALPGSFSLRGSPGLGMARYHPYSKSHLQGPGLHMGSIPSSSPYYSPYALYTQRLGSASALGYQ
ncbi:LOW QUALITY PROTEIN: zinc finger protein 703-like [Eucyclogobius newberryi]|uniref:LOW QUALITY PROTEIN: zinc finger protein 703-like n=1 Tax=Eucyclogobius newberryi TaxID=166745 RepID=UPI003B5A292A